MATDAPVFHLTCLLWTFIPTNHQHLPAHWTIVLLIQGSTHLLTHLFSSLFSFWLICQLIYWSTYPPENKSTCLSWCYFLPANFFFMLSMSMVVSGWMTTKTQLPGSQIYLFINLPVHFDAFIPDNCKELPIHSPYVLHIMYLIISMLSLWLTM